MRIGDVANRLGMPASTIRYYEKVGLIERQRRVSGRREFDDQAMFALEFVRLSQAAGFTIAETKSLLDAYAENPSEKGAWKDPARNKRTAIRAKIKELERMDYILSQILTCCCPSLTECVAEGMANGVGG